MIVPKHVVIIPDGNRRWAKERGLKSVEGHFAGYKRFFEIAKAARKMGIKTITVWGFSTENWSREKAEVAYLMSMFDKLLKKFGDEVIKNKVRFRHLGRKDRLTKEVVKQLENLEKKTSKFEDYNLNLAIDYGGRDEILRAFNKIINCGKKIKNVTEDLISQYLDTNGVDDPDYIIRTSGEKRVSGMMPWQAVYAELYFPKVYFPDFTSAEFAKAIKEYSNRQRRFGK